MKFGLGLAALLFGGIAVSALAQEANPRIFIADADGKNVKLLVEIPDAGYHGSPHWSADGKLILMNAMPRGGGYEQARIYACAVGGPFNGNVVEMGVGGCAKFSPDMTKIAFHVRAGNPDQLQPGIWVMRDDGTDRKRLCDGTRPRWSVDSKTIYFTSPQGDSIEMVNADGSSKRLFLRKTTYQQVAGVSLSPDGKYLCAIAYPQQAYDGVLTLFRLNDPTVEKVLYRGQLGWDPAWSPDGRQIMFWRIDEKTNDRRLVVIDANNGGEPKELANQEKVHMATDADWSPDSRRIVFASDRADPAK